MYLSKIFQMLVNDQVHRVHKYIFIYTNLNLKPVNIYLIKCQMLSNIKLKKIVDIKMSICNIYFWHFRLLQRKYHTWHLFDKICHLPWVYSPSVRVQEIAKTELANLTEQRLSLEAEITDLAAAAEQLQGLYGRQDQLLKVRVLRWILDARW